MRPAPATLAVLALAAVPLWADVRLPALFGDDMVLQRDVPLPVWGWCAPGEEVTVEFAGHRATARGDAEGRFRAVLPALEAGGPWRLTVRGANELVRSGVLVGEVWVASGQSNMEWPLSAAIDAEQVLAAAQRPKLRLFHVPRAAADAPRDDVEARWELCSPESAAGFSAVAYFFGAELLAELDVPVGLIETAWGGSRAEAWIRTSALEPSKELRHLAANPYGYKAQNVPGTLYDGMLHPLIPYAVRGAIWYQGESNVPHAREYRRLFPLLIETWRRDWGGGDFPFYFVQLAPFRYQRPKQHADLACAELREAQLQALALPNTGMAVTMDVGDPDDVHPRDKRTVGHRLALWALARDYGRELDCSGPLYRSIVAAPGALRVRFRHADEGLATRDGAPVSHLELAGADQVFHPAEGAIEGAELVVTSAAVPAPVAVRYAWSDACEPNLCDAGGLPASPFRSDDWPGVTGGDR